MRYFVSKIKITFQPELHVLYKRTDLYEKYKGVILVSKLGTYFGMECAGMGRLR